MRRDDLCRHAFFFGPRKKLMGVDWRRLCGCLRATRGLPSYSNIEVCRAPRSQGLLHLLTTFQNGWKKIQFERWRSVCRSATFLCNWHCVDILGIPADDREIFFVCVPQWLFDYYWCSPLVVATPMVFSYHYIFALCVKRLGLLLRTDVMEPFYALLSFFSSVPSRELGWPYSFVWGFFGSCWIA